MEIRRVFTLRGPNIWAYFPVFEALVDLKHLELSPSNSIPGFNYRIMRWLPSMYAHECTVEEPGGFFERLRRGTWLGHILEHVTIELQNLAGTPVSFGRARETSERGVYKVAIRYRNEQLGRACLDTAFQLLQAAIHDTPFDIDAEVRKLRELADDVCLGPGTAAVVAAAKKRGIPSRRLGSGSLIQLGHGIQQRRVWTGETDRTSAIAESIAQDKDLTRTLLHSAGVPVPEGRPVSSAEDAWAAADDLDGPVVVKPQDGNHGRGVFTGLTTREQVTAAYVLAEQEGSGVLVEQLIPGAEHRVLVIGGRVVAAARGDAAIVTGDGQQTISQLIEQQLNNDPRRGDADSCPLYKIQLNSAVLLQLERQGFSPDSVPGSGVRVLIQRNGNLALNVTDQIHPRVAATAVLAAQVVGLDIAGIDLVAEDISQPLEDQGGGIVEVNAGPGFDMHLKPSNTPPVPVGEAIVDNLFSPGETGRIPIVAVTGTNGKTTTARIVSQILQLTGRCTGLACSDGLYLNDRKIEGGDCSGAVGPDTLLLNPRLEAGVFEVSGPSILSEGMTLDRCDVGIVTNIAEGDHLGFSYIDSPELLSNKVKRTVIDIVGAQGTAVLNAEDPLVARMAEYSSGGVIYFARDAEHPVIVAHRGAGLRAVIVQNDQIVLADGDQELPLLALSQIPLTHSGRLAFQCENVLAATAAAWAMSVPPEQICAGLTSLTGDTVENPGRFNVFHVAGALIVVDDCRNSSSLAAAIAGLTAFPHERRAIVYAGSGREQDLERQGQLLAGAFHQVDLYPRTVFRTEELQAALPALRRGLELGEAPSVTISQTESEAVQSALARITAGDLLILQPENQELVFNLIRQHLESQTGRRAANASAGGGSET